MRKRWIAVGAVVVLAVVGASALFFARPVQIAPHRAAEYAAVPGDYRRLLADTHVNAHHMRAADGDRFDVLLMGDSVVFGWAGIPQDQTAVSILSDRLGVPVGNISANSWGPPNLLGYVKQHGAFGARVAVLVLSTHDAADDIGASAVTLDTAPDPDALAALDDLIALLRERGVSVIVARHRERDENGERPGRRAIRERAAVAGHLIDLELPTEAYRDFIHPTAEGQRLIADQLEPVVRKYLAEK